MFTVFRRFFVISASFSLALNLILLVPALFMLQVFDRVLVSRSTETLVLLLVLSAGWLAVGWGLDIFRQRVLGLAAAHLDKRAGVSTLQHLLDEAAHPDRKLETQQLRDLATVRTFLTGPSVLAIFDAPWVIVYLGVITLFHPYLGAVSAAACALLVFLTWLSFRMTGASTARANEAGARAGAYVQSSLRAAEVIAAHGMGARIAKTWLADHKRALMEGQHASRLHARFSATSRALRQALQIILLAVGAWLVIAMNVSAGVTIAATILLGRLLAPLESVAGNWKVIMEALKAWQRLGKSALHVARQNNSFEHPEPVGRIDAEGVFFVPQLGGPATIRNMTFAIQPGEVVAVMGPSGSGKSTLARLMMGIWKPSGGKVRLDGIELQNWNREVLGNHIGYCPQDVQLIRGSVAQNISRFSEPDDVAVVSAAKLARCHELISRLPQDYRTEVGENGAMLSGGQRQRIALARALYGNPKFVVLDEPNANLDTEGERDLDETIKELRSRRITTVIITQRTQAAEQADRVFMVREGMLERIGKRRSEDGDPGKSLQVVSSS